MKLSAHSVFDGCGSEQNQLEETRLWLQQQYTTGPFPYRLCQELARGICGRCVQKRPADSGPHSCAAGVTGS